MSERDVSRRGFLVMLGGAVLGTYALPGIAGGGGGSGGATGTAPMMRRLLSKPLRKKSLDRIFMANGETAFFLLWTELDANDRAQVMIWTPETREEIAEANRFYQEACAFNVGPAMDMPPLSAEETVLTEAILDAPEQTGPRLAYAAYLTAQGNSLGEFLEISQQLESLPPDDPSRDDLDARWSELIHRDGETWLAPLGSLGLRPEIFGTFFPALWLAETGLIEEIDLEQPGLLPERAEELIRAAPAVHRLKISYDDVDIAALAQCPYLARLSSLEVSSLNLTSAMIEPLLASPYLIRLRRLDLGYNDLGSEAGAALARTGFLPRLHELDLSSVELADGTTELFRGWQQGQLRKLSLAGNQLDTAGVQALAACPALAGLQSLKLSDNGLDAAGLEALQSAAFLPGLRELDLGGCSLSADLLRVLLALPLPALTTLRLNGNRFGEAGAVVLTGANWPALRRLDLESCELGDAGLTTLAAGSLFHRLQEVNLRENRLGPRGVSSLAAVTWTGPLRVLNLRQNRCAEEGARALARCAGFSALQELDLNGNNLGAAGAAALAASPHLKELRKLYVTEKFLGPTGKAALLQGFGEDVLQIDEGD